MWQCSTALQIYLLSSHRFGILYLFFFHHHRLFFHHHEPCNALMIHSYTCMINAYHAHIIALSGGNTKQHTHVPGEKVLLKDVKVLTLKAGMYTTGRRSAPSKAYPRDHTPCLTRGSPADHVSWRLLVRRAALGHPVPEHGLGRRRLPGAAPLHHAIRGCVLS